MSFSRRIIHYAPGPGDNPALLQDRAIAGCWFELHRQGGCGAGELRLRDDFPERQTVQVGDWIAFEYAPGLRWYLGRVEHRAARSPAGVTLRLEGMGIELNEAFPGGFNPNAADGVPPHRYSRTDLFPDDPDRPLETVDAVDQPQDLIALLLSQYVLPRTHITYSATLVEPCDPPVDLVSFKFRGEESVRAIIKDLALRAHAASWGVDALGRFFFLRRRTSVIATYQEGVDLLSMEETCERNLLYNRLALTGDYVYRRTASSSAAPLQFYRWRANYIEPASRAEHGERRLRLWIPWIRTSADSRAFAREFFRLYAQPPVRYSVEVAAPPSLPVPWGGRFQLLDRHGQPLVSSTVETIRVSFDRFPRLRLELGPEDPHNLWAEPPHDERWEIPGSPLSEFGGSELSLTELSEHSSSAEPSSSSLDLSSDLSSDNSPLTSELPPNSSSDPASSLSSDVSSGLSSDESSDHSSSLSSVDSSESSDDLSSDISGATSLGTGNISDSGLTSSDLSSDETSSLADTCPTRLAGTGQNVLEQAFEAGEISWNNPANITSQDNAPATILFDAPGAVSYALVASNFGFNIPSTALIEGITVHIRRKMNPGNAVSDFEVRLRKAGTSAGASPIPESFTEDWDEVHYGGEEDLWEENWTPDDINNSGFGVALWVTGDEGDVASVDSIRITVCYHLCQLRTAGAGTSVAEQATGFGDVHWTNPGNITGEDGAFASVSLLAGAASLPGRYSFALYASNFGFDIPDNAEILHIRLLSTARNGGAEQETGYAALALVDSDGSTGELNLDGFFLAESLQTDEFVGAGGDPLWGGQWSPQQINSANFGAKIWSAAGPSVDGEAYIDRIQMIVCYKLSNSG